MRVGFNSYSIYNNSAKLANYNSQPSQNTQGQCYNNSDLTFGRTNRLQRAVIDFQNSHGGFARFAPYIYWIIVAVLAFLGLQNK